MRFSFIQWVAVAAFCTVSIAWSADYLALTREGEFYKELDVGGMKPGELLTRLYSISGEGYTYPWAGEASIDFMMDERGLFVNGIQVGVNLQDPEAYFVEDANKITCALVYPYQIDVLSEFPNLVTVTFGGPINEPDLDMSALPKLKNLKGLYFAAGALSDGQVRDIVRCTGLRDLDFSVTILPEGALKGIKSLSNLRELGLASVSDEELLALKGHKNLESLTRYWEVCDTGWVDFLESLPNLAELEIIQAEIADEVYEYLAESNKLEALSLPFAGVYGEHFRLISRMTNLIRLDLTGTEITNDDVKLLGKLMSLEELSIGGGGAGSLTDEGLAYLSGLTSLKHLDISSTPVTDDGLEYLAQLSTLKSLNLVSTGVTDNGLKHLEGLKNLRFLDLSGTIVTEKGLESFKKALPGCDVVQLY